jgi:hypothetical protein
MKLILNNVAASNAIAYSLRGEWDGFNAVHFNNPIDLAALRIALALVELELNLEEKIEYCWVGQFCFLFDRTTRDGIPIGSPSLEQLRLLYGSEEVVRGFISDGTNVIFHPQERASAKEIANRIANRIAFCRKIGCQFVVSFQDLTALFGEDISPRINDEKE